MVDSEEEDEEVSMDSLKNSSSHPQSQVLLLGYGKPIHPMESPYYDPIMNPLGAAPPGVPPLNIILPGLELPRADFNLEGEEMNPEHISGDTTIPLKEKGVLKSELESDSGSHSDTNSDSDSDLISDSDTEQQSSQVTSGFIQGLVTEKIAESFPTESKVGGSNDAGKNRHYILFFSTHSHNWCGSFFL